MTDLILVLNAGSSSIKFALHPAAGSGRKPALTGEIGGIGTAPQFKARNAGGESLDTEVLAGADATADHAALVARLLDWLLAGEWGGRISAAGHRVVHGGRQFDGPVLIDAKVMQALEQLVPLAPLHQPHSLAAIRAIAERLPELPQVACFDTAFHRTQPRLAQLFALPRHLSDEGIIRYGFHGLSYHYIAGVLPDHLGKRADGRIIVAHLGNGASMCAMKERRSIATSMGFTALDGLMMGRRSGSIDPGVLIHLQENKGLDVAAVGRLLYSESGLYGVSGISNDMRDLEASADPHAREAIDLFCYRAALELSSLAAALEGLDAIVFTAGIGEHSEMVRRLVCARLSWLGVALDQTANEAHANRISTTDSAVDVLVIPTDEEAVIAEAARHLI
ncbi:acetate/propionate family kinase [Hoeflea poritis]|uniref:Acetate kinase n=1 Tax=Hoeflea poritis TaxID=2993659 RepID=A0ABT4VUF6_9HYPH|nr:acetate/propionate family kinase [Hoeflea poritis]MDA4848335.1 acetate/propionate family kinase [Hoeflea poritis]